MRIRFRGGVVKAVLAAGPDWQELLVEVEEAGVSPALVPAWHDAALLGPVVPGERVILNTTARWLGLGTGGMDFVYWVPGREGRPDAPASGHIVKLRYAPGQIRVQAVEERLGWRAALPPGSPRVHGVLRGTPVVVATLHSQLAPVAAGVAAACPGARVAYVMTDGGALPAALSRLLRRLRACGLVRTVITCGHAYGGDLEAVHLASALAAARRVARAHVVVVAMGPGSVGTGTGLGTTAVEAASALDAAAALGGTPVFALRAGDGDARPRHRGLSHHALTALRLARAPALVALPAGRAGARLAGLLAAAGLAGRHLGCQADGDAGLRLLRRLGLEVTTMGRGADADPLFFRAAAAAGHLAGLLARARRRRAVGRRSDGTGSPRGGGSRPRAAAHPPHGV